MTKERLTKLFEFLKAYTDLRYPPVLDILQQPKFYWLNDLPAHPSIELFRETHKNEDVDDENDIVLRVTRPAITNCQAPPPALLEWLKPGWHDINGKVETHLTRNTIGKDGKTLIERFDADLQRVSLFRNWQNIRSQWLENEIPARQAMAFFQTVYEWYGIQEREDETVELVVGDGLLQHASDGMEFNHPVILQKMELEFYPEKQVPQFVFRKREQPPELYVEFLRAIPDVDSQQLARCAEEMKVSEFAPLSDGDTDGYIRRLIQGLFPGGGEYVERNQPENNKNANRPTPSGNTLFDNMDDLPQPPAPVITRAPVIFIRKRRVGPGNVFELVLEDIAQRTDFPSSLLRILDMEPSIKEGTVGSAGVSSIAGEEQEILLSKPANREQLEIAKQLARQDCVLVQGPPGTGKTHTIANLLGHLLAQGKKVLVTAHTPKALRVLRQKVVAALQPLCISVLHKDKQSQEDLQDSVQKIHVRLSEDAHVLERAAQRLREERKKIIAELREARQQLLNARQDEIRDVVFAGKTIRPIEAAKKVKAGIGTNDWIPSPVKLGEAMPLTLAEITALYQTNARVSLAIERELVGSRPDITKLPTPTEFSSLVDEMKALSGQKLRLREELWDDAREPAELEDFDRMLDLAKKTIDSLRDSVPWQLEAIQAGRDGAQSRRVWESLAALLESTWCEIQECNALVMQHGPEITDARPTHELLTIVEEIITHQAAGKSFGMLAKLTKRHWFDFRTKVRIGSRELELDNTAHVSAVRALLRMNNLRCELKERWERNISCKGGLACADLGACPEQVCRQFVPQIKACLNWHSDTWMPLENDFGRLGFKWQSYLESIPPEPGDNSGLRRIRRAILGEFDKILESRSGLLNNKRLLAKLQSWHEQVPLSAQPEAQTTQRIRQAIKDASPQQYQAAHEILSRLKSMECDLATRRELLKRLGVTAPAWASAIENRLPQHNQPHPPGDVQAAWEWRQLHDELERRAGVAIDQLQQRLETLGPQLLDITAQLVEKQTWMNQVRNIGAPQRRALGAYAALRKKITKSGKGVRDAQVRAESRRQMAAAKDAVPVWIMPLAEVADTFDPRKTRFDVVIIDEASQCDPTALFALYLGGQTIIVGDDEQVTPVAAGVDMTEVSKLINVYLPGISYNQLYDGTSSVYDLAKVAFGGVIRLTEHFRCAPDIIAFSNNLSYKGEIKPLREASAIPLTPHVVHYRLQSSGTSEYENTNEDEADVIASLICAMSEQPEYAKNEIGEATTIGVISLVGERQAVKIDSILRENLEPAEYRRRQILCGDAAHFQGDERDVMFLSVVDCPPEQPPLPMRQEGPKGMYKKRFNVAASRARNQMWVVHSLNHETDLKVGDYRRRIIEHALDPKKWELELRNRLAQIDPRSKMFEGPVLRCLMERGYNVIPQYQVGAYYIDLVVVGNGRRLAIECDGEIAHPPEKLQEDMDRQAILERLGWIFVRIRGGVYFRDEERAMKPVFQRLHELGIEPELNAAAPLESAQCEAVEQVIRRAQQLRDEWYNREVESKNA